MTWGSTKESKMSYSGERVEAISSLAQGTLGLALIAAWVLLTSLTRDLQISRDGAAVAAGLVCGLVGMLVARRQARNPEG